MHGEEEKLIADLREAFNGADGGLGSSLLLNSPGDHPVDTSRDKEELMPVGSRLGDFEITGELGSGGMGVVYRARQISLGREVALKVLPAHTRHGRLAVRRFHTEAQAAARLHHTNVVSIYARGEHQGRFFYAMELVDGVSLDTIVHSRPELLSSTWRPGGSSARVGDFTPQGRSTEDLDDRSAADDEVESATTRHCDVSSISRTPEDYRHLAVLIAAVADGLQHAHESDVIHRDIKPHNLLLGSDNRLHIADFGLARLTDQPHLTIPGEVMGTPSYLSPEQIRGDGGPTAQRSFAIDHRTDIYSLGVTLYEVLVGRRPFPGDTREQIIESIRHDEPLPPRRVDDSIPVDLETICLRAMDKDPDRRHPTAALLAEDLRRFADRRPILSRRTGRIEKAFKWMQRHKSTTAAIAATTFVLVLATSLGISTSANRRAEAERLLQRAYERIVYLDYRSPELATADLDQADELGAQDPRLHLLRAMIALSTSDNRQAIELLHDGLRLDAEMGESYRRQLLYALALVQWVDRDLAGSHETFMSAENMDQPRTAPEWFLRGMAAHFDKPEVAIESYRQASVVRAQVHEFYPQAVLHLARARNQQMYRTRAIDMFSESKAALTQLVENDHYGAYPYYLLSIAHRLAAEIYEGSVGTRDDGALVEHHYAEALAWARRGQLVNPQDTRTVNAEATCLESMGLFAEALDARTRAINLSSTPIERCEGHHYRWRLCYWTGLFDKALEDIAFHAECDPDSLFYAHFYPALVHAELGDMEDALAGARAIADVRHGVDPQCDVPASHVLWSASCLRLLGEQQEADELLDAMRDTVDFSTGLIAPQSETWMRMLYAFVAGEVSFDELTALAEGVVKPWSLRGEAHFHAGAIALASGRRSDASNHFFRAYRAFDGEEKCTFHAKIVCVRLRQTPDWPAWIPVVGDDAAPGSMRVDKQPHVRESYYGGEGSDEDR